MYFDSHCHLNFKAFRKQVSSIVQRAREVGVTEILIPGTNYETSIRALEIASNYEKMHAAVGIHPHHVFDLYKRIEKTYQNNKKLTLTRDSNSVFQEETDQIISNELGLIESLISNPHVVAIGEAGLDRHMYRSTRYENYVINNTFLVIQKTVMKRQVQLSLKYNKSLVLHNREAREELLSTLNDVWDQSLCGKCVFHCCEAHKDLLSCARKNSIFIGVDGDISYDQNKQSFIREVPLEFLVIETDSPFILPEPYRSNKEYPNEPRHVVTVADWVARLKNIPLDEVVKQTSENAKMLFGIPN